MKYLSLDIETTGLNPEYCQILQLGAVIEDTTMPSASLDGLPSYNRIVYHDKIVGEPYALHMNAWLLDLIIKRPTHYMYISPDSLASDFSIWLSTYFEPGEKITVAGKNVQGFDMRFLERLPRWNKSWFHHRSIDPAVFYWHQHEDKTLPDIKTCAVRAGIDVARDFYLHSAVSDARLVVELIRRGIK